MFKHYGSGLVTVQDLIDEVHVNNTIYYTSSVMNKQKNIKVNDIKIVTQR